VREQLLDAIERCFDQYGIRKTTLADVAQAAGVSRTTVYRYFSDRQELVDEVFLRNIARQWHTITQRLKSVETLDTWLVESMLLFQQRFKNDEIVNLYIRAGGMMDGLVVALSAPGLNTVIEHFDALFVKAQLEGKLAPGLTREDIAEWIHRTNHSLVALPSKRIERRQDLRRWLSSQICGGMVLP